MSRTRSISKEDGMKTVTVFIKWQPVLTYYIITFAIFWGGFLLVGGPGFFAGTN
jgi:hypothetical protein